ncbi:hypothetical protein [Bacillus phage phiAGATE]|uniref:Uncharacterized protein n=1 Tax=Bacillus phage phiAGATE TaxID=1204533 RepID=L0LAJ0_9CAUD|nr:hypothetical protein G380_gp117 [Bacillus phage phiAGATE]AGB62767.1 hypothetical protein [Bacillus phage phiAGATE]
MEWVGIICMIIIVSGFSLFVGSIYVLGVVLVTKTIIREVRKKKVREDNRRWE